MTTPNPKPRLVEHWTTVQVAPLPAGWVNVWQNEDGTEVTDPCPAILLQECREQEHVWDLVSEDGTKRIRSKEMEVERPYFTRTVYAISVDGYVEDSDLYKGYLRTEYRTPLTGLGAANQAVLLALRDAIQDDDMDAARALAACVWGATDDED